MSDTTEQWMPVKGYDGLYEVSSWGNVNSFVVSVGGRLLKPGTNTYGYLYVGLCLFGVRKTLQVHRLVAEAYLPNPEDRVEIKHINGIKTDNRVENLEWVGSKAHTVQPDPKRKQLFIF